MLKGFVDVLTVTTTATSAATSTATEAGRIMCNR